MLRSIGKQSKQLLIFLLSSKATTSGDSITSFLCHMFKILLLLLKSVEFNDDVALLLSVAGLVVGPHVTSESEIGGTDSSALRTSWTCLRLCGSCVTGCTSFFRDVVIQPFKKLLR